MIALAVIGAGIGYAIFKDEGVACGIAAIIIVLYLIIVIIGGLIHLCSETESNRCFKSMSKHNIQSLVYKSKESKYLKGRANFFLGVGSASLDGGTIENQYYYTIVECKDKGYMIKKFNTNTTYIKEDNNLEQPYVEAFNDDYNISYKENWIFGGIFKPFKSTHVSNLAYHVLHVPEGTIKVEWNVDMNN